MKKVKVWEAKREHLLCLTDLVLNFWEQLRSHWLWKKKHIELCTLNQVKTLDFFMNDLQYISTVLEHTSLECMPTNLTDAQD